MPRSFISAAMVLTLVSPWDLRSSTMVRRFAARCSAFAFTAATRCLSILTLSQRFRAHDKLYPLPPEVAQKVPQARSHVLCQR